MQTKEKVKSGWGYVLLALLIFLLLGMDAFSGFVVGPILDGRSLSDPDMLFNNWYARAGVNLFSTILWVISVLLVVRWAKRRGVLSELLGSRFDSQALLFFGLGVIVLIVILRSGAPNGSVWLRFVSEYHGFEQQYPGYGMGVTVMQHIYYIAESAMVVLSLAAWQRAGEVWTDKTAIPWGGVGLALTWGLAHGVWGLLPSLLLGVIFVGARKNALLTLVAVLTIFVVFS